MSLKNKLIRFCDATGTEQLGTVASELGTHYLIKQKLKEDERIFGLYCRKTSIKILEVYPFEYAHINWYHGYANDPVPVLRMTQEDHTTNWSGMVYEQKDCMYWAENQGLVSYYYYKGPEEGFGGRTFTLKMKDGTTKDLIGPWSSGCYAMNKFFPESTECTLEVINQHGQISRYASNIRTHLLKAILPANIFLFKRRDTICPSLSPEKIEKPSDRR